MSGVLLALTHPAVPLAWWAANSPQVVDLLSNALGGSEGGPRRLAEYYYYYYPDVEGIEDRYMTAAIIGVCVGVLVPVALLVFAGMLYKRKVTDQRGQLPQPVPEEFSLAQKDFTHGLCGCCQDLQYFLHGWCCMTIRAADTYQAVNVSGFWCVACAFLATWAAAQGIGMGISVWLQGEMLAQGRVGQPGLMQQSAQIGWFVADAVLAIWLAGLRKQLRAKLGDEAPDSKFCMDCLKYWWCGCCTAVQDARQVDGAQGVRVDCCCTLSKTAPVGGGVGGPVVVGNNAVV